MNVKKFTQFLIHETMQPDDSFGASWKHIADYFE
jgi:hypothetical protein